MHDNPSDFFQGKFEIEVIGDPITRVIDVLHPLLLSTGQILYLVGPFGLTYNFSNIIKFKKVADGRP